MALTTCKDCGHEISSSASACPHCGRPVQKPLMHREFGCGSTGCAVVLILGIVGIVGIIATGGKRSAPPSSPTSGHTSDSLAPHLSDSQMYAREFVKLKNTEWQKGGFGSVLVGAFTVKNAGRRDIQDVKILCEATAQSGTILSTPTTTLYKSISAGKSRRFEDVNIGFMNNQSEKVACYATDVVFR